MKTSEDMTTSDDMTVETSDHATVRRARGTRVVVPLSRSEAVGEREHEHGLSVSSDEGSLRDDSIEDGTALALAARIAGGDATALARLYDSCAGHGYALALRVLGDEALAQDAVQEAFLTFWRVPAAFDAERGSLLTFLLTLVHRRAVDILRREGRQRVQPVPEAVLLDLPDVDPGPAELAVRHATLGEVRRALAELPEPQRLALSMAYFDGRSQREIAILTGTPLGTVKTRMVAAVRNLRGALREFGEAEA